MLFNEETKKIYFALFDKNDVELLNETLIPAKPINIIQNAETSKLLECDYIIILDYVDYYKYILNGDKEIYIKINNDLFKIKRIDYKYYNFSNKIYKIIIYI